MRPLCSGEVFRISAGWQTLRVGEYVVMAAGQRKEDGKERAKKGGRSSFAVSFAV
jgi:hypothetical protein